jgi:2-iminobutanoate/2-iminopropanoate deaminase
VRKIVETKDAPGAIGPYSQAVKAGPFLFTAGQIALDPADGGLTREGIEAEARRVMENLRAVLAEAGMGFGDVVKATLFLCDLGDFAAVNGVYGEYFSEDPPARSAVQVASLPKGARVEIEMVAWKEPA